jgi:hypothetical protein
LVVPSAAENAKVEKPAALVWPSSSAKEHAR